MEFHVSCECGQDITVAASAAGTVRSCPCGRVVRVPALSELKRQAGLPAYNPSAALLIEHMLADRELPGTAMCVCCNDTTEDTIEVSAECEKVWIRGPNDGASLVVAFFLVGIWAFLLRQRDTQEFGRTLILRLPVRLCAKCQRTALRKWPGRDYRVLGISLAVPGLVLLVFSAVWGGLLVIGSFLIWWLSVAATARRQAAIKDIVQRVPIYEQLLREYPHANLRCDLKAGYPLAIP